jgi:hypothetical protein
MVLQKPAPKYRKIPWRCHLKWEQPVNAQDWKIIHPVEDCAIGTASQLYVCVVSFFCSAKEGNGFSLLIRIRCPFGWVMEMQ